MELEARTFPSGENATKLALDGNQSSNTFSSPDFTLWNSVPLNLEDDAIITMEQYGLTINDVPQSSYDEWTEFINTGWLYVLENHYDMQYYNMAVQILEEYRQQN